MVTSAKIVSPDLLISIDPVSITPFVEFEISLTFFTSSGDITSVKSSAVLYTSFILSTANNPPRIKAAMKSPK